jgi:hypothetical protein
LTSILVPLSCRIGYWLLAIGCWANIADAQKVQVRFVYQLDFLTPGIIPASDMSRKQILHRPNFRNVARERPQRWQRCCFREENFGLLLAFSINDFGGIQSLLP